MPDKPGRRVPFVGLTGGIGSGKSTALAALEQLGVATLSSDAVVRELLDAPDVREAVADRLGAEALDADGRVDRAAVADRVFARSDDRAWLEGMLWPRVGARMAEWRAEVERRDPPPVAAVVEVPLLFEAGMEAAFDATVAIVADEELRSGRAAGRGHVSVAEREQRQLTQDEKARRADHALRNDGTPEELKADLSRVIATITS